jgi:hypothetical protein
MWFVPASALIGPETPGGQPWDSLNEARLTPVSEGAAAEATVGTVAIIATATRRSRALMVITMGATVVPPLRKVAIFGGETSRERKPREQRGSLLAFVSWLRCRRRDDAP